MSQAPQPSRHSTLSPSAAYRWMTCPGSVALEKRGNYADQASENAAVGTFMHHVAAFCLEQRKDAKEFIGYTEKIGAFEFTFNEEHRELVQAYVDTVWSYVGLDGTLYVEVELDISDLTGEPDAIGTADALIVTGDGRIIVIDLKTGRNRVSAERNHQLIIYSMAAYKALKDGTLPAPAHVPSQPSADAGGDDLC